MQMSKPFLRKKLLASRDKLSDAEVRSRSDKILNTLSVSVDWNKVKNIHIYLPIEKYKEVDTRQFINLVRRNHPDIRIEIAPSLSKSKNIPKGKDYDLVIVPVVGFDKRGYRLGYGGGYYDRLLANNDCQETIGLAYSFCKLEKIPEEPHDVKIDRIITEEQIVLS